MQHSSDAVSIRLKVSQARSYLRRRDGVDVIPADMAGQLIAAQMPIGAVGALLFSIITDDDLDPSEVRLRRPTREAVARAKRRSVG